MEITNIIDIILNQGIFCVLFVYFYVDSNKKTFEREQRYIERENKYIEQLNQGAERERNYQNIISDLNERVIPTLEKIEDKLNKGE